MPSPDDVPYGPLFAVFRNASKRARRRMGIIAVVVLATLALTWPVYPQFSSVEPYVLGLPLSLAWVVAWLGVVFAALGALYWTEEHTSEGAANGEAEGDAHP